MSNSWEGMPVPVSDITISTASSNQSCFSYHYLDLSAIRHGIQGILRTGSTIPGELNQYQYRLLAICLVSFLYFYLVRKPVILLNRKMVFLIITSRMSCKEKYGRDAQRSRNLLIILLQSLRLPYNHL